MTIQRLAVSPKQPTILADQTHLDLPGLDIWFIHVNTLFVVPTKLDVSRFEDALSRVLQLYPHAAGKLRYMDRRWVIELANTAIPLDIEYKLDASSGSLLNGDWVVQDNLSPFVDIQSIGASVINECAPLLCVKLTFFDNETCIGVAWQHSLGDGAMVFRFLHTLSQFYQGLSPKFATPNFKKYHFPTPSDSLVAEIWPLLPRLHKTCALEAFSVPVESLEHVRWRIDSRDIKELHSALSPKKQSGRSLSVQDCIIAYLVAVLNYTRSNPVQRVRNITSYRHVKAPFITENAASNLIMEVAINVPMDIAGIATAVRNALVQYQDPDYIHSLVAVTSHFHLEAYGAWKAFSSLGNNDELIVSSVIRIDWWSAHFGCPDGTQFHMDEVLKDFVKIIGSNPVRGVDGVWEARQSVEISMGVAAELKPKILETLARGVRCVLNDQRARL